MLSAYEAYSAGLIPALSEKGTPGLKVGIDPCIRAKALALFGKGVFWGDNPLR